MIYASDFGVSSSGSATDNTSWLNAALAAASPGDTVRLPKGTINILGDNVALPPRVSLEGEGSRATDLHCESGVALTAANISTIGMSFRGFKISGVPGVTTGLYVGSNLEDTAHARIEDVAFHNHLNGVDGGGTFALFDSALEDVDFYNCTVGLGVLGSQTVARSCKFRVCGWGVKLKKQSGVSVGGLRAWGCLFVSNNFDIVTDGDQTRQTTFDACWFEQNATSVIGTTYGQTQALDILFTHCLFQPASSSVGNGITNIPSFTGTLGFDSCRVDRSLKPGATLPSGSWASPVSGQSLYFRRGCTMQSPWGVLANA